jgi:hypothetical protein
LLVSLEGCFIVFTSQSDVHTVRLMKNTVLSNNKSATRS